MAESAIRWTRGDYIRLGQAVSLFNKTINEHKSAENKLYLPEEKEYQDLKNRITTRKELNRVIASLRRITNENALELISLESGQTLTKYEYGELKKQRTIASRRLAKDLTSLNTPEERFTIFKSSNGKY